MDATITTAKGNYTGTVEACLRWQLDMQAAWATIDACGLSLDERDIHDRIRELLDEARTAGDTEQVAMCIEALDGDTAATAACLEVIFEAAAMDDDGPTRYCVLGFDGDWTVVGFGRQGEHDLNARGEPIATLAELRDFIRELGAQGLDRGAVADLLNQAALLDE